MAKSLGKLNTKTVTVSGEDLLLRQLSCLQVDAMVSLEEAEGSDSMNLLFYLLSCSVVNEDGTYQFTPDDKEEVLKNSPIAVMKEISEEIMEFNGFGDEDEGK